MSACSGNCNQGRSCTCATERDDPLAAARGIWNGLKLAAAFWLFIVLAIILGGRQ